MFELYMLGNGFIGIYVDGMSIKLNSFDYNCIVSINLGQLFESIGSLYVQGSTTLTYWRLCINSAYKYGQDKAQN